MKEVRCFRVFAHIPDVTFTLFIGAIIVVIVWYLDLQLHIQSVNIPTNVVSSYRAHGDVFSKQH